MLKNLKIIKFQKKKELISDVLVAPNIVVEIEAEEITKSPMHTAGKSPKDNTEFALRFPRFLRYRDDKNIDQATTVKEVQELYNLQYKKNKKV